MPKRDMLINNVPGEECRIAIVEDGKLEELYHERTSVESHVGSIFKGKVVNVEPAIQAAFIDFGLERNGFLHVTDLHPRYFPGQHKEETERVGHKTPHRERPPIQRCLKRGQEILVQVIKEGIGTKGPTVTSYLSIPGRFLVMMPAMERLGVSRKVDDDDARREMRKLLDELNPPEDFGFIIRTAGIGRPKTDLKRDLAYLVRLWKNLEKRMAQPGIGELYTESDLMIRTIRDVYSTDIDRIIVDEPTAAKRASDFLAIASPRAKSNVLYYDDPVPLFHRFGVETQIETIHSRRVPLPSGGSLVIDSTEALVAIDVNSGKMRNSGDAETTAYRTNVEACDEVCRQLRLRDLGGVVVIDLIDMRSPAKRRTIEQRFRDNLKRDRARTKPLAISQFGILEMTRQRMRPSLNKSVYSDCHYCHGEGTIKNIDAVVLDVMRRVSLMICRKEVARLAVTVSPDVAFPLLNRKRGELVRLEQRFNVPVQVRVNPSGAVDFIELLPMDERGNPLTIDAMKNLTPPVLQPVESAPGLLIDDDMLEDEEVAEMEKRATMVEEIDERDRSGEDGDDERALGLEPGAPQEMDDERPRRDEEIRETVAASQEQAARLSDEALASGPPQDGQAGEGGRRKRRRRRGRRGRSEGESREGGEAAAKDQPRPPQHGQPSRGHGQGGRPGATQGRSGGQPRQGAGQDSRQSSGQGAEKSAASKGGPPQPVSRGYSSGRDMERPAEAKPPVERGNMADERDRGADDNGGGEEGGSQQPQLGPDGQPVRRRRRRGGRRHRRRREAQMRAQETGPDGAPLNDNAGGPHTPGDEDASGQPHDGDRYEGGRQGAAAEHDEADRFNRADHAEHEAAGDDDDDRFNRVTGDDGDGEEGDERGEGDERDHRGAQTGAIAQGEVEEDSAAVAVADDPAAEEVAAQLDNEQAQDEPAAEGEQAPAAEGDAGAAVKKKRRSRRGGRGRSKKTGADDGQAASGGEGGRAPVKKKPTRRPPRRKPPGTKEG